MTNRFCTLAFSLLALSSIACGNGVTALSTHGRNIYRLALAHLRPDAGAVQIVGTTYEGRLCAFQLQDGRLRSLWDAPLDSFAFAVTAFNPGGGAPEDDVAVGTSGGKVMAFDAAGRALWSFDFVTPVYSVAAVREPDGVFVAAGTVDGRLVLLGSDGKVRKEINFDGAIRCLLAGRFEGDGRQELFVTDWPRDSTMYAQVLDVPDLTPASPMWEKPLLMQSTSMADHGINAVVGDPWRRGRDAVISQRYVWLPDVSTAPVLKFGELGPKLYYAGDYRMSSPALGRFKSGGGVDQIAMVRGEELGLFHLPARPPPAPAMRQPAQDQQTGKIKKHKDGKAEAAEGNDGEEGADVLHAGAQAESNHSFTDILTIPGAGTDQLLLGSAPNGDDNLYLVTPDGADSWKAAIPRMPWQGCIARVNANIEQLGRELNTWHGAPAGGQPGPYVVVPEFRPKFGHSMPEGEGLARMIETNRYYCQRFPYPERIRFTQEFEVSEPAMADSEGMPAAQIIDLVKRLEAAGVPWIARIGHGGAMFVSPRTADAMLAAAPKTAVGFSIAEQSGGGKQTVPFFAGKVMPLVAVAHAHHVNFYLNEKGSFWASAGADPDFQKVLFDPKYYGTVVPGDEDSNSRSPDLNMLARAGLWLSGRTESWACRLIADAFAFNRIWDWSRVMVGSPHLRALTSETELGARHFVINCTQRNEAGVPNTILEDGVAQYLEMLGKGVIAPPRPEQMKDLSPVALNIVDPTAEFKKTATGGHDFPVRIVEPDLAFGRLLNWWGMAPTAPHDLSRAAWGRRRQFAAYTPDIGAGGRGLLMPIPGGLSGSGSDSIWTTTFTTNGEAISGAATVADGVRNILAAMDQGAASLPVVVKGDVFYQCVKQSDSDYQIVLVDSGYLDPADRAVTIRNQLPGNWLLADRVAWHRLQALPSGQTATVMVPAGCLRVLELVKGS